MGTPWLARRVIEKTHGLHELFLFLVPKDICLVARISGMAMILRCLSPTELDNKILFLKQNHLFNLVTLNKLKSYFTNKIYIG